jgi:uncharacterized DUF497 family protein
LTDLEKHARLQPFRKKSDVMIDFEWDITKAKTNLRKHRVDFSEATTVLRDSLGITIHDPDRSVDEDRYITIGASISGRLRNECMNRD